MRGFGIGLLIVSSTLVCCRACTDDEAEVPVARGAAAKEPAAAPASRPSDPEVVKLSQSMMSFYISAKYDRAIELAREVLERDPENRKAWQIVGASSCYRKDPEGVKEAEEHLDPSAARRLEAICKRIR